MAMYPAAIVPPPPPAAHDEEFDSDDLLVNDFGRAPDDTEATDELPGAGLDSLWQDRGPVAQLTRRAREIFARRAKTG